MNEILYEHLISPWFKAEERPILQKKDLWLFSLRRALFNKKYSGLLADIHIHNGFCNIRYCTCRYFTVEDRIWSYFKYYLTYSK